MRAHSPRGYRARHESRRNKQVAINAVVALSLCALLVGTVWLCKFQFDAQCAHNHGVSANGYCEYTAARIAP